MMTMNDDDRDKENDNNQSNLLTTNSIDDDVVDSQSIHHISPKKKRNRRKKIGYQRKKRKMISRSSSSNHTTTSPPLATSSNSNSISSRSSSCSSSTQSAASSNHTITTRSRSSSSTTNNNSTIHNNVTPPPPLPRPSQLLGPKEMKLNAAAAEHQRIMISNLYATKYYNKDPQLPIKGRNGIVAQISSELNLSHNLSGTISRVIIETKKLLDKGLSYDGKKRKYTLPQKRKIQDGSLAQQLLIDCKEKNKYSNTMTAKILSAQIPEFKDNPIGPSAVSNALRHMKHPK